MWRSKTEDRKRILKEVAKLGFEVGYFKHYEGVGWVESEKSKLIRKAEELKIEGELEEVFTHSKEMGKKKREIDDARGLNKAKAGNMKSSAKRVELELDDQTHRDLDSLINTNFSEKSSVVGRPSLTKKAPVISKKGPTERSRQTAYPSLLRLFSKSRKKRR